MSLVGYVIDHTFDHVINHIIICFIFPTLQFFYCSKMTIIRLIKLYYSIKFPNSNQMEEGLKVSR